MTSKRFEPIAMAYGDAPGCKLCNTVPMRIEYARDMVKAQLVIVVVCKSHHVMRSLDLERILAAETGTSFAGALVVEIRRKFDDVLAPTIEDPIHPSNSFTAIVRRDITCGACGAPSDPKNAACVYCNAHLAGVNR